MTSTRVHVATTHIYVQARLSTTPTSLLAMWATYEDRFVRAAVASNRKTPRATLDFLAEDADSAVRGCVAGNPSTREQTLRHLYLERGAWPIMAGIASNPLLPNDLIEAICATSGSWGELILIANNPAALPFLEKLAERLVKTADGKEKYKEIIGVIRLHLRELG